MCTVFAESEVISLIGRGEPRENIARGVIESVVSRVATMAGQAAGAPYYLTGGLCENAYRCGAVGRAAGVTSDHLAPGSLCRSDRRGDSRTGAQCKGRCHPPSALGIAMRILGENDCPMRGGIDG